MLLVLLSIISVNSICNYIETDNEVEFFQLDTCAYFDTTNNTSWGYYCNENETDGTWVAQQIHYSGLSCQGLGITMGEIYDCNGADDACYCIDGKPSDCQLATVQTASCNNNASGYQQYTYVLDVCRVNDVSPASSSRLQCDSNDSSIIAYEYNGTYNCTGSYTEKEIAGDSNVTQTDTCYTISCNFTSSSGDTSTSTTNEPTNTPKPESDAEIVYEWTTVDYNWENAFQELEWIANGSYIMENNCITGVKLYKGTIYVTVPRWRTGVPSTLNKVVTDINGNPLLQPYPSLAMQDVNNCEMLQNIQSMEITPNGKMWILDVGRKYFFDPNVNVSVDNSCPPKLWIWDINKNELDRVYIFPNEIANYTNSFLNDLVLDVINNIAYISDVFGYPFPGGVVTYDYNNNISNRFADPVMNYDGPGSPARNVIINGQEVPDLQSANDGIALSPDLKWLYFCPLASYRLYRVPAENARMYKNDSLKAIEFIGNRTSQMDGMTFDNNSILYYGSLSETAVRIMEYEYDIDENDRMNYSQKHSSILVEDNYTLQWADTFAWGEDGYVYFSTNRLHRFFLQNMDYDGGEGANFRINRVYVGAVSYMMGQISSSSTPSPTDGDDNGSGGSSESGLDAVSGVVWLVIVIVLFVLVVVFGGLWIKARKSVNNQDDTGYVQMAK